MTFSEASSTVETVIRHRSHLRNQKKLKTRLAPIAVVAVWSFLGFYDTGVLSGLPGKSLIRLVSVGLLAVVLLLNAIPNPGVRQNRLFRILAGAGLLVAVVSTVLGNSLELGFLKIGLYALVFYPLVIFGNVGAMLTGEHNGGKLLLFVAFVLLALGLYRAFSPGQNEIGNTNLVSGLAVCAMPIFLVGQSKTKPTMPRSLFTLAVLLCVLVCILNHSRGALGGGLAVLGPWFVLRRKPAFGNAFGFVVIAIVLVAGLFMFDKGLRDYTLKGQESFLDSTRANELRTCLEFAKERPLLGYGFGLSWRIRPDHFDQVIKTGRMSWYIGEFGNSVLAILAGGGLILLAVFIGIVTTTLLTAKRAMVLAYRNGGASQGYQTLAALVCGVIGLIVHAQAEGWILSAATMTTFTFWAYLGALMFVSGRIRIDALANVGQTTR